MTDPSKQSQTAQILRYLRAGESLTAIDALNMFGCLRLAARMNDIKRELLPNETIVRDWVKTSAGKRVAKYSLKVVTLQP